MTEKARQVKPLAALRVAQAHIGPESDIVPC